jgi:hypothetical protein
MNMSDLSDVIFGDSDSLSQFMYENAMQHRLFAQVFAENGVVVPEFPLFDALLENLDDWLLAHQVEHQAYAGILGLENPINLLDVDFNVKEQFDDFLSSHLYIHQQIASRLIQ